MEISWQSLPEDDVNGVLKGYKIRYKIVKTPGNPRPAENAESKEITVEPRTISVVLKKLTSYSKYEIQISAFTTVGEGPSSIVFGG